MEKNKNRTDLLAAGRKKLQQYRQKKDGKGSKSSGKGSKSNSESSENAAASSTDKQEVKLQAPELERTVSDISKGVAEVLMLQSREESEASDADVADPPQLTALPETDTLAEEAPTILSEAENQEDSLSSNSALMETESSHETLHTSIVDLPESPDSINVSAVEVDVMDGEDQVPDEAASSSFKRATVEEDKKSVLSPHDEFYEALEETRNEDEDNQVSLQPSITPDASSLSNPEQSIQEKEDLTVNSERAEANLAKTVDTEREAGSVQDEVSIRLPPLAEAVKGLNKDEFKVFSTDVWAILEEQFYLTHLEKDTFHLQLAEEFELNKEFDRERFQLVNEISVLGASLDEFKEQNESLSFERDNLRNQVHLTKTECEELSAKADGFQKKIESLRKDLADCGDMAAALQTQNGNLDESLTLMADERRKAEEDKAKVALENENLALELKDCRASLELLEEEKKAFVSKNDQVLADLAESKDFAKALQMENENLNDFLATLRESRARVDEEREKIFTDLRECRALIESLEEEKKDFVSNKNNFLTDLAESRDLAKSLQVENDNINSEKEKLSFESMRSKHLVESLEKEIANLNERLTLKMDGITNLQEEKDYFANEFERLSTEIVELKCKIDNLKEVELRVEQLTEENSLLYNDLNSNKAKNQEVGECQLSSQSLEAIVPVENSDIELIVLFEIIKQNALEFEAKKSDLVINLTECRSRADKLETQLNLLHEEQNSTVPLILKEVGKLDTCFGNAGPTDTADTITCVAASVEAACINHKEVLKKCISLHEENRKIYGSLSSLVNCTDSQNENLLDPSLESLMDKLNADIGELKKRCIGNDFVLKLVEVVNDVVKIEDNEMNVDGSASCVESLINILLQKYKEAIEEFGTKERSLLELQRQKDQQYANEILVLKECLRRAMEDLEAVRSNVDEKVSDISELEKRCIGADFILKLVEGIRGVVQLEANKLNMDEAAVCVESLIHFLLQKYKEANEALCMKETSFIELQGQKDQLSFTIAQCENEISGLKESLKRTVEDLEAVQSNAQEKVAELSIKEASLVDLQGQMDRLSLLIIQKENEIHVLKETLKRAMEDLEAVRSSAQENAAELDLKEKSLVYLQGENDQLSFSIVQQEDKIRSLKESLERAREDLEAVRLSTPDNASELSTKGTSSIDLQAQNSSLSFSIAQHENEILTLKKSLRKAMEDLEAVRSNAKEKASELEQSEHRVSSLREKLGIAVTKGKGLIVQRDGLKQSLAETSNELERCLQELQLKDSMIRDLETKLKSYSESAERVEALESELSYIRNSATAIRESFLLKDSVLQRIEEILEDLEMPENIHSRDITEKVEWLVRSVAGNLEGSTGGGSYSDSGFVVMDAWKEDTSQQTSNSNEDLKRKYEDLHSKFYELAEQNEMLDQSLKERNILVQRWEEVLDKINMPAQFRSMEPEDRIQWLGAAFSEAIHHCDSLTAEIEDSQRRILDLEEVFQAVNTEKNNLSRSLEILSSDYDKVLDKAQFFDGENDKLQNEVSGLQEKFEESQRKLSDLEASFQSVTGDNINLKGEIIEVQQNLNQFEGEIIRLQCLISDALQDPNAEDTAEGISATQSLEVVLKKLLEKLANLPSGKLVSRDTTADLVTEEFLAVQNDKRIEDAMELTIMQTELQSAMAELISLKEEKKKLSEENQSLIREVELLISKKQDLQDLLNQEEQKSASVREKLNLAVRKGKSLVQQRDGMRQVIDEVTSELERLKSEIMHKENAVLEYEKRIESVESERLFLRNRLAETESNLQESGNSLSMIVSALSEIDIGSEFRVNNPIEKIVEIRRRCDHLENDSKKSKRAAELLLAELNEVQERNDRLQDEAEYAASEISELKKQMHLLESDKSEALSRVAKITAVKFEEREKEVVELKSVNSGVDQLKKDVSDMRSLLVDALSRDLEFLQSLEASMMSSLTSADAANLIFPSFTGPVTKENFLFPISQEHGDYNKVSEVCSSIGQNLQNAVKEIGSFIEILNNHSASVKKEANILSELMASFHQEITSRRNSCGSMKGDIIRLESVARERDAENNVLRKSVSILYEACKSSVMQMENLKAQIVGNGQSRFNLGSITSVLGDNLFRAETHSSSEEFVKAMADSLVSAANDLVSTQPEILEAREKEMKSTIYNLQKLLQEKDVQKDRICSELVGQIKAAESTANSYLKELQPSKDRILELEKIVNELENHESNLKEQEEKVRSLSDLLAAKEQEIEALMQALDEEEGQIEYMKNKVEEIEGVLQQKNIDLENSEASRLKSAKKLSVTVNKFDELHSLSANLLAEVEKLQSQLEERDSEISFLRQEITRCTNDALVSSQNMNNKRNSDSDDFLSWLSLLASQLQVVPDVDSDAEKTNLVHQYKDVLEKKIASTISELEDLRSNAQDRENLLQAERSNRESLENSLRQKESQLSMFQGVQEDSTQSEIVEVEPVINKWTVPGPTSIARTLRKVNNNDQVAIAVDIEPDSNTKLLDDEDDDKAHGFKSLTTSKIVPRFTRPVSNFIDGLWVSCDRALMRQPALRLGVIIYWVVIHALLAAFVV